jgi:vesicle-fusing ATPase
MFNRNNLPAMPNPFGARPDSQARPQQGGYASPGQGPPPGQRSSGPYDDRRAQPSPGYQGGQQYGAPSQRPPVGRQPVPSRGGGGGGRNVQLRPAKSPSDTYTLGNLCVLRPDNLLDFTL